MLSARNQFQGTVKSVKLGNVMAEVVVTVGALEIDPDITDRVVLLADRKDGKPLDAKEGPYRLVVPHDKRHMRWVRQVTRISVEAVAESASDKRGGADKPARTPPR
jgi:molybdopterin-binding protein